MARIIDNNNGRRNILLNVDDVLSLVREYQQITQGLKTYDEIRQILQSNKFYLPEEIV
ncbi:hypothetical protein IJG14_01565 [bacterium]|nr:hypothetical protein [bacterium]